MSKDTTLPKDTQGVPMQIFPNKVLATSEHTIGGTTATNVTLNSGTVLLELQAGDNDVYIKFKTASGVSDVTTSDNGWERRIPYFQAYAIPVEQDIIISLICKTGKTSVVAITQF